MYLALYASQNVNYPSARRPLHSHYRFLGDRLHD